MSDTKNRLNILWLWPDILNQHGDRGNVMALVRICGLYGIDAKVTRVTGLKDEYNYNGADIVLLGPGELAVMPAISGALSKRAAELRAYADSGGLLLATGTTGAAIGVRTRRLDGTYIDGMGLLDMECQERGAVLGDDLIYRRMEKAGPETAQTPAAGTDGLTVYGIQIHMMDVDLAAGQKPFGKAVYGYGNNGSGAEGAVSGNVIFTNALGPVLVKNPWLTVELINRALGQNLRFDPGLFGLELASAEVIKLFNEKKEKPK